MDEKMVYSLRTHTKTSIKKMSKTYIKDEETDGPLKNDLRSVGRM